METPRPDTYTGRQLRAAADELDRAGAVWDRDANWTAEYRAMRAAHNVGMAQTHALMAIATSLGELVDMLGVVVDDGRAINVDTASGQ